VAILVTIRIAEVIILVNNSHFTILNTKKISEVKSIYNIDNWIVFDLEWEDVNKQNNNFSDYKSLVNITSGDSVPPVYQNKIVTCGFEDSYGNSGCLDITDFDSQKSFLMEIKEKLSSYQYCFAWGSKAVARKEKGNGKVEGINGDLVVLDYNFKANGLTSIIKYDKFTSIPYIRKDYQNYKQSFIADIDLLSVFAKPLVKNIFKNRYKSLRLDEVGKALLGYGKLDDKSGAKLDEMSIEKRKSYCLQDSHIVAQLARINNGQILKIMDIIASHTGLKFEEVCHKGMSSMWRKILNDAISKKISLIGYDRLPVVLRKLYSNKTSFVEFDDNCYDYEHDEFEDDGDELSEYKENSYDQYIELLEQRTKERKFSTLDSDANDSDLNPKEKQKVVRKYKGATVLSPKRGLHYNAFVFDVTSLYPTMIINYNISPETIICHCCKNNIKAREMFSQDYIKDCQFIPTKDKGYWICQRKKGLFSKILRKLTEQRIKYKKEGKDLENLAIKSIINSGYGVFGHPYFKYYDPKVAEIITTLGRQTLSEMQKIANSLKLTVLYGDTDSLFVNDIDSKESATKFIDECKRKLQIDVNHEKTFRKLILVSKKHYIGVLSDPGKGPIIKGMEGIKSDRPEFIQTVFKEMVEDIKNDKNPIPKLKQAFNELDLRQVPAEKLSLSLTLNKNPKEYSNDCLQKRIGIKNNLKKGDTLVYYKCDKQEVVKDNQGNYQTKRVSESDNPVDISYAKHKEMLVNSVKDVLEILGYDIEQDLFPKKRLVDHYLSISNT
jgi:DNA polymerase elongation subunit (family B)